MDSLRQRLAGPSSNDWTASKHVEGHDAVIFVVESILCRKLDLASSLETGSLVYEARLGQITCGEAYYDLSAEPIEMLNILVRIVDGSREVPEQTASYSSIRWVNPEALSEAFRTKEALMLFPGADPIEICIHGLCVSTATELIDRGEIRDALTV